VTRKVNQDTGQSEQAELTVAHVSSIVQPPYFTGIGRQQELTDHPINVKHRT
jgi:hypothetical protein